MFSSINYKLIALYLLCFLLPFGGKLVALTIVLNVLIGVFFYKKSIWLVNFKIGKSSHFPLLGLFLLFVIGTFWSDNIIGALKKIEHSLSFAVFPLLIPLFNLTKPTVIKLFSVFVLSCTIILIVSFLDFFHVSLTEDEYIILGEIAEGNRPGNVYQYLSKHLLVINVHRTYFSAYLLISITFIINYYKEYCLILRTNLKWIGFTNVLILILGLICLQSKANILILIIILGFFLVLKFKRSFKWLLLSFFMVTILIFLLRNVLISRINPMVEEIQNVMASGEDKEKDFAKYLRPGSTETRYMIYKSSTQLIYKSPFFGYGTGDVKDVLAKQNFENGFKSIAHLKYGPHSQFLYMCLGYGVIGLLVFFSLFVFPIFDLYMVRRNSFTLFVILILFLNCLTESFLLRQEGIIPTALILTVLPYLNIEKKK